MAGGRESIHELLPWYVSETLGGEESSSFASHLPACSDCRREVEFLGRLREQIERHGEEFFAPHPEPETLVGFLTGELEAGQGEGVRRHLALCPTCAVEARIVRSGEGQAVRPVAVRRPAAVRRLLPWAAAAAVLLAVALPAWYLTGDRGPASGFVRPHYLEPPQRNLPGNRIVVPPGAPHFQIVFPVDPVPGGFPLAVTITDAAGRTVLERDGLGPDYHYRDRFLFLLCRAADFPPGDYHLRVTYRARPDRPAPAPLEFAFTIIQ